MRVVPPIYGTSGAGTTTDPVEKPMELLPLGPVLFIDTAGIDDTGELVAEDGVLRPGDASERSYEPWMT